LSSFELKGYVEELGLDNVIDLYYAIPRLDLKGRSDKESIDMVICVRAYKVLTMYIVHWMDEVHLMLPALLALNVLVPNS